MLFSWLTEVGVTEYIGNNCLCGNTKHFGFWYGFWHWHGGTQIIYVAMPSMKQR